MDSQDSPTARLSDVIKAAPIRKIWARAGVGPESQVEVGYRAFTMLMWTVPQTGCL